MKPVMQTRLGTDLAAPGNCFAAAIASILEVSLESVPDEVELIQRTDRLTGETDTVFYGRCWSNYWVELAKWLRDRFGLGMMELEPSAFNGCGLVFDSEAYMIASGKSSRDSDHAVVCKGRKLVHDPHPEGGGLVGDPDKTRWVFFLPLNPAQEEGKARRVAARIGSLSLNTVGWTPDSMFVDTTRTILEEEGMN